MDEVKVKIRSVELTLTDGTMFRPYDDAPFYCDVGRQSNGNKVLFYYDPATDIVDYVGTIIGRLPDVAAQYLENVLKNNDNVLVRLFYLGTEKSNFEIYYDCTNPSVDIETLIDWMANHNDFEASGYRYTEIKNGHQTVCE